MLWWETSTSFIIFGPFKSCFSYSTFHISGRRLQQTFFIDKCLLSLRINFKWSRVLLTISRALFHAKVLESWILNIIAYYPHLLKSLGSCLLVLEKIFGIHCFTHCWWKSVISWSSYLLQSFPIYSKTVSLNLISSIWL